MKRTGFTKKLLSFITVAVLLFSLIPALPQTSWAMVTMENSYLFDDNVDAKLQRKICDRIFKEDFNGSTIDLSDLGIPESSHNRQAVECLILYGFPSTSFKVSDWTYIFDRSETEKVMKCQAAADRILDGIAGNDSLTDAEKACLIHDRLIDNCEYAYEYDYKTEPVHEAYGALVAGRCVCDGYSHAYMYLCRRAGVECFYQDAFPEGLVDVGHAWNVVYITEDGERKPYYVDSTWDDDFRDTHYFFMISYDTFSLTHYEYDFPELKDADTDMKPEKYMNGTASGAGAPRISYAEAEDGGIYFAVPTAEDFTFYFGTSETADGEFEPKDENLFKVFPDKAGTYFAAAKNSAGTSDICRIEVSNVWRFDAESATLYVDAVSEFKGSAPWSAYLSEIKNIELSDGLTEIPSGAFEKCTVIKEIEIPGGVVSIGERAFFGCEKLEKIDLPKSIEKIGLRAFAGCRKLKSILIPEGTKEIGEREFEDCAALESVVIPEGVETIGNGAFKGCRTLKNVEVPDSVTYVGDEAFYECYALPSLPNINNVRTVGASAFEGCRKLTSVVVPDGVESVGSRAFCACSVLADVTFPAGLKTVGKNVFKSCKKLEHLTYRSIPESIDGGINSECRSLGEVYLVSDSGFTLCIPVK